MLQSVVIAIIARVSVLSCIAIWSTHPLLGMSRLTLLSIVLNRSVALRFVLLALSLWLGLVVYSMSLLYRHSRRLADITLAFVVSLLRYRFPLALHIKSCLVRGLFVPRRRHRQHCTLTSFVTV